MNIEQTSGSETGPAVFHYFKLSFYVPCGYHSCKPANVMYQANYSKWLAQVTCITYRVRWIFTNS